MSIDAHKKNLKRREVLCGGGAYLFAAILEPLLRGAKPVCAQTIGRHVPEVDRVSVRVVIDSYQFAVAAGKKVGSVDVQHFGWGLTDKPPGRTLISEFGLSMHAQSQRGSETRNFLMDFGFTSGALNNNLDLLGIDLAAIDALVLSHGHYDHFGGVVGFLRGAKDKLKSELPLYIGGEECFCAREWVGPPVPGNLGALDRQALEQANLAVTYAEGPSLVGNHAFTTGQIGLRSFETVLSPSAMKIGSRSTGRYGHGAASTLVRMFCVNGRRTRSGPSRSARDQPSRCVTWTPNFANVRSISGYETPSRAHS